MPTCIECSAALTPTWKFCIVCGAPVERSVAEPAMIPGAIRPELSIMIGKQALRPAHVFGWSLTAILTIIMVVGFIVALVR